ncbi:hypothetical protein [Rugosimonospora africana]|uniref:Uncharacterized protein n=1 Tax=Rugosimonospora africana TaxID=556532 RepID=A0A8J3QT65_9ACTN|nr:hypothetical protein [Rugosimonospora africana]GIH16549.1 hypothetical protein Raf01_47210 [Rugosimonospora africana]
MLIARSAPECRLYIDLHACSCGEAAVDVRHRLRTGTDGSLDAVYEGQCPRCGLPRRFEFTLDPATPPPPPAFGGPTPSRIICPGQFALVADRQARSAPLRPTADPRQRARGRAAIARALAAQEEVAKFIPPGGFAVPGDAFTSADGLALYRREPDRFTADRLAAVTETYREVLTSYDDALT